MIAFADKQAARAAGWMTLATVIVLAAGIVALSVGIPMIVSGLFFAAAVPCAFVTVSLSLVAVRGRGGEAAAVPVDPATEEATTEAAAETAAEDAEHKADETAAEESEEAPAAEVVATADATDG